jgi:hypothetical protein
VLEHRRGAHVIGLDDPGLCGRAIEDARHLVVSRE